MNSESTIQRLSKLVGPSLRVLSPGIGWPAEGTVRTSAGEVPVAIYTRAVGGSGRNRPTERRFQNPANVRNREIQDPTDGYALLLGLWQEEGQDRSVIVALDAYCRLGLTTRMSLFMPLELLQEAADTGSARHTNSAGEPIYAFRPENLANFVERLSDEQTATGYRVAVKPNLQPHSYRSWNLAIESEFFSSKSAGRLVYLDLEDDILQKIRDECFPGLWNPRKAFEQAVKATLDAHRLRGSVFRHHRKLLSIWNKTDRRRAPQCLALLAFLVHIAETMRGDETFASSNYYGRLAQSLGIADEAERAALQRDFRQDSLRFWRALNQWLELNAGSRGLPTAYAFDHRRYVGIPISQALIRAADRHHLQECFVHFGLSPGQKLAATDMEQVLGQWILTSSITSSVKNAWKTKEGKTRIAEVACLELEAWDGQTVREDKGIQSGRLLLAASVLTQPRLTLGFALTTKPDERLTSGKYALKPDASAAAKTAVGSGDWFLSGDSFRNLAILTSDYAINYSDVLLTSIELVNGTNRGVQLLRKWKPVVVLKYDYETQLFIEVTRAELAERHIILAHESIAGRVDDYLGKACASGYQALSSDDVPTVPGFWTLFHDVRIAGLVDPKADDLQSLVPVATTSIVFSGGLNLPRPNSWHVSHPPSVQIASLRDRTVVARLIATEARVGFGTDDGEDEEWIFQLGEFTEEITADLGNLNLDEGDYKIVVNEKISGPNPGKGVATATLRLRSGNDTLPFTPYIRVHAPTASTVDWVLNTQSIDLDTSNLSFLQGSRLVAWACEFTENIHPRIPETISAGESERVDLYYSKMHHSQTSHDLPACIGRGHHIWELPPADNFPPRFQQLRGRCKDCGLEKWFGGRSSRPSTKKKRPQPSARVEWKTVRLGATPQHSAITVDDMFDAMVYLRDGTRSNIDSMLEQVRDNRWFSDELLRNFSCLAHCEVGLDRYHQKVESWQMTPPCINVVADHAFLSGVRNENFLTRLENDVAALDGELVRVKQASGLTRVEIHGVDPQDLSDIAASVSAFLVEDVEVSIRPSRHISERLPCIIEITNELATSSWPDANTQLFDLSTFRWRDVRHPDRPGAYRFTHRWADYGFVGERELDTATYRRGDYRLVKHLAAAHQRQPMFAFDPETSSVFVPLGAQLPWVYERALVLESGIEPQLESTGLIRYQQVTDDVASIVWRALNGTT